MAVFTITNNVEMNICKCDCKELIDQGVSDKGFIWNPSNCECECHKSCDVGQYLDYEYCKCRRKLVNKLVEECTQNVEEVKLAKIIQLNMKIRINAVLAHYTLCYFQYYLRSTLELALILFIFIGSKRIKPVLILKKQQFIKCNSFEHIYGKRNEYQKSNF